MFWNLTVMGEYLVVLLLSVLVFFGAFYVNTVDMKISKLDNIILEHEKEIKELKEVKAESKINKGK